MTIINGLCLALGWHSARNKSQIPLVDIIFHALRRRAKRFAVLAARFEAGMPPPQQPSHGGAAADGFRRERVPPVPGLVPPRSRAWLLLMLKHEGAHWYWQFRALLEEPEMVALLAADPRVGRVLRPLWWMLGAHPMPDVLRPPPRPPGPPRPRVVRPVRPPPPPVAAEPPAPAPRRWPYIPGFGPAPSE